MSKTRPVKPDQFIVKSNDLVEARYRLSLQESRVVLWLLTQIRPEDEEFKTHQLKILEFSKLLQVDPKNRYIELAKITKRLMQRVMQIREVEKKRLIQVAWLSSAIYEEDRGIVSLKFDPVLKPYLLQLKECFTKINITDTLKFKSVYTVRIFELLLQYESIGVRKTPLEELRAYCGVGEDEYALYADLKRKVINRAKNEINAKTEYEVDYREIKESRRVAAISWTFKKKTHFEKAQEEKTAIIQKELRSANAIIEQLLEYGFTKQAAQRLIKAHEEQIIINAIKAVEHYQSKHIVKNAKALVSTAIKEKWNPEVYQAKKNAVSL